MQKATQPQNRLFLIDAATAAAANARNAAFELPGVIHVESPSPYQQDPLYCQMLVLTADDVTEQELDEMLWKRNVDYVGVVEMVRH